MLAVVSHWGNDKFHVADCDPTIAEKPPLAFRQAFPEGAAMVEKDIDRGFLNEPGMYQFVVDDVGTLLGYEKLNDI